MQIFRISSSNLSLQNVAVCDVDVRKGENAVRELQTEYGADRVIFIKTDVTNVAELEGNVEKDLNAWNVSNVVLPQVEEKVSVFHNFATQDLFVRIV